MIGRYRASKVKEEKTTFRYGSVRCMTSKIGISNDFFFAAKFYLRKITDRKCYVPYDSSLYSDGDRKKNKNLTSEACCTADELMSKRRFVVRLLLVISVAFTTVKLLVGLLAFAQTKKILEKCHRNYQSLCLVLGTDVQNEARLKIFFRRRTSRERK